MRNVNWRESVALNYEGDKCPLTNNKTFILLTNNTTQKHCLYFFGLNLIMLKINIKNSLENGPFKSLNNYGTDFCCLFLKLKLSRNLFFTSV